jgi:F0F1-type ATP synthase assembly protein I
MPLLGPEGREQIKAAGRIGAVSIEIGLGMLIGWFGGRYLDGVFGTGPWIATVGLVLGLVAGMRSLYKATRKIQKLLETDDRTDPTKKDEDREP